MTAFKKKKKILKVAGEGNSVDKTLHWQRTHWTFFHELQLDLPSALCCSGRSGEMWEMVEELLLAGGQRTDAEQSDANCESQMLQKEKKIGSLLTGMTMHPQIRGTGSSTQVALCSSTAKSQM